MASVIITLQIKNFEFNTYANLHGTLTREADWHCTKVGFKYGLTATPTWDSYDTSDVDKDGEFIIYIGSLNPYTVYYYQAYAIIRHWEPVWEEILGHYVDEWVYDTIYGNWLWFRTNAEANILTIIATNATKTGGNESIKFIGFIEDNANSKVSIRGFKYGLTEADTWSVSEAVGAEGTFNLTATGIPGDVDIYFRAYAITPTGTYYGEYEKASTKQANPVVFLLVQNLYGDYEFYLTAFDQNGNIYNAWELTGEYWDANCICADDDGNTYAIKDRTTIIKRNKNGALVTTKACSGYAYSIAFKPNGKIAVRGRSDDLQYLKEYDTDLNVGGASILSFSTDDYAYTGYAVDNEGYSYVINYITKKIEKWDWEEEWDLQEAEFETSAVHTDTDIIDLSIDILTGAKITFWEDVSLPSPLIGWDYYYAIKTSENHIKIALTESDALAGIAIDLTTQGEGTNEIYEITGEYKKVKIVERDISSVFVGRHNYIAIADNLIYSNEYNEQGWTIPTTLLEDPTDWTPSSMYYVRGLSSLGGNKFLIYGASNTTWAYVIACYNSSKEFVWESETYFWQLDFYSAAGIRNFEAELLNIKAEQDSTQTAIKLYGEITNVIIPMTKRGFEYLIQDEEPGKDDIGIEVEEEDEEGFDIGEYNLHEYEGNDVDFWDRLYNLEENTIWWFRAICKDAGGNKSVAATWMKNVPTMTTFECTEVSSQRAIGNGELTDKGANIVTERGFRIIKEYVGDLFSAIPYEYDGFNCDNLVSEEELSPEGALIGFLWRGDLYRDSLIEGNFEVGIYENIIGGGFLGESFGIYLKPNDTYKIVAMAVNALGMGFGEGYYLETGINALSSEYRAIIDSLTEVTTGQIILPSDPEEDEIVSEISAEKTITLGTIPEGCTVTRIGIRLGRTEGCSEIHVYEDGIWTSGGSHTFYITGFVPGSTYYKMPYIILNHGDYEEEIKAIPDYRNPERLEEWLTDYPIEVFPEVEDEDDLDQTVTDSSVGDISYRTIIKDIRCEKIGEQSFIDKYGRRRSQTINNHLIQTHENCKTIAIEYVEKFQILKMKIAIDYDIPIPFEREDVILLGDGKHKYREDEQGSIAFKVDGAGTILQANFILAKIRKIDSNYISGTEVILSLELEV